MPDLVEFGTHLPILRSLVEVYNITSSVEYGCGQYSTPYLRGVGKLVSFETDRDYAEKYGSTFFNSPRKVPVPEAQLYFVDCSPELFRWKLVNRLIRLDKRFIVLHDTESIRHKYYSFKRIRSGEYSEYRYIHNEFGRGTSVFSKEQINITPKDHRLGERIE